MVTDMVPGRVLLVDGDMLAYYCAGNKDTLIGEARQNLLDKVASAKAASGAESVKILITSRASHKGHRYAVARVKPYQGQRANHGEKPRHWEYLRTLMESGQVGPYPVLSYIDREADDAMAYLATVTSVVYTQDKDMRTLSGWHLDWLDHTMTFVPSPTVYAPGDSWSGVGDGFRVIRGNKVFGRAWFWQQILHGDTVDNIPGLPYYTDGSLLKSGAKKGQVKQIPLGEKAEILQTMAANHTDLGSLICAQSLYMSCYGALGWCVHLLEQGILLWLRTDAEADPFNVTAPGNPLADLTTHADYPAARAEIEARIKEADAYKEADPDAGTGAGVCEEVASGEHGEVESLRSEAQPGEAAEGPCGVHAAELQDAGEEAQGTAHDNQAGHRGPDSLPDPRHAPRGVPWWVVRLIAKP